MHGRVKKFRPSEKCQTRGIGEWCYDQLLAVVSIAVPIWLGVYAGWVRTDTPKAMRAKGIGAAAVGAVVGAALGFHVMSGLMALITAIIGAAVVSNLSLLVLDIWTERAARRGTAAPAVDLSETEHLEPALHRWPEPCRGILRGFPDTRACDARASKHVHRPNNAPHTPVCLSQSCW